MARRVGTPMGTYLCVVHTLYERVGAWMYTTRVGAAIPLGPWSTIPRHVPLVVRGVRTTGRGLPDADSAWAGQEGAARRFDAILPTHLWFPFLRTFYNPVRTPRMATGMEIVADEYPGAARCFVLSHIFTTAVHPSSY